MGDTRLDRMKANPNYGRGVVRIEHDPAKRELDRKLDELLAKGKRVFEKLPVLPKSARNLYELAGKRDVDTRAVVAVMKDDPIVATRVLQVANSARFAPRMRVKTLQRALAVIGLDALRSVALEIALDGAVFRGAGRVELLDAVRRHSAVIARVAERVAQCAGLSPPLAYMAGLLHDVGLIVPFLLSQSLRSECRALSLREAFEVVLRRHTEVGRLAVQYWGLGEDLASAVEYHHAPNEAPPEFERLARVVRAAEGVVGLIGWQPGAKAGSIADPLLPTDLSTPSEVRETLDALGVAGSARGGLVEFARRHYEATWGPIAKGGVSGGRERRFAGR